MQWLYTGFPGRCVTNLTTEELDGAEHPISFAQHRGDPQFSSNGNSRDTMRQLRGTVKQVYLFFPARWAFQSAEMSL
jgi:hypothetical protein